MIRLSASTLRRRVASFLLLETTVTVALSPQFDRSFSLGSISDNIADPVCLAVLARLAVVGRRRGGLAGDKIVWTSQ